MAKIQKPSDTTKQFSEFLVSFFTLMPFCRIIASFWHNTMLWHFSCIFMSESRKAIVKNNNMYNILNYN